MEILPWGARGRTPGIWIKCSKIWKLKNTLGLPQAKLPQGKQTRECSMLKVKLNFIRLCILREYSYHRALCPPSAVSEVGKMTTSNLRPIPLPSTQQVADLVLFLKKGRVDRSMLTTLNLWKGTGKVGYQTDVEHSTYLQVSMPTSVRSPACIDCTICQNSFTSASKEHKMQPLVHKADFTQYTYIQNNQQAEKIKINK